MKNELVEELEHAVVQAVRMRQSMSAVDDEHMCETCRGSGTIDDTLGGEWNSNPVAECPDCDGLGYLVSCAKNHPVA